MFYQVEAETNGAGSGALPSIGSMSPPTPPTLAYFQGQDSRFTKVKQSHAGLGIHPLLLRPLTDVVLIYADSNVSVATEIPGAPTVLVGGFANGAYLSRSSFRPA
jgi:hypothetical protein